MAEGDRLARGAVPLTAPLTLVPSLLVKLLVRTNMARTVFAASLQGTCFRDAAWHNKF